MRPRRFHAATGVFALPGGTEDNDLWVERQVVEGHPVIRSVWEPSEEERRAIADGANVTLMVWGSGTPPVAIAVTREPLGKKPDTRDPEREAAQRREGRDAEKD
jgi:hypothetical protein